MAGELAKVLTNQVKAIQAAIPAAMRELRDEVVVAARRGSPVDTGAFQAGWSGTRLNASQNVWTTSVENDTPYSPYIRTYDPGPARDVLDTGLRRIAAATTNAFLKGVTP
jgi:hypothetical protein